MAVKLGARSCGQLFLEGAPSLDCGIGRGRRPSCRRLGHITLDDMVAVYCGAGSGADRGGRRSAAGRDLAGPVAGEGRDHRHARCDEEDRQAASRCRCRSRSRMTKAPCCWEPTSARRLLRSSRMTSTSSASNCATGPKEMNDAVRYLGLYSPKQISVLPNAGHSAQ